MKTLLLVLLPLLAFAQNQLPDTLYLIDGRTAPCLITAIDEDRVYFNYDNNRSESVIIPALQKVSVESFGTVFLEGKWQNTDVKKVNTFAEDRLVKINNQRAVDQELQRLSLQPTNIDQSATLPNSYPPAIVSPIGKGQTNKWSFGVLYVPYYSGSVYSIIYTGSNPYNYDLYVTGVNQINLEAQVAYAVIPQLRLTFDAGYSASITENSSESHYRDLNSTYQYDQGYEMISGLKILDFNLGAKYYFQNFISNRVSVYALLGFGKQIAFAQENRTQLFVTPNPDIISEDNEEEFTEDINSPWHFNFGFGAEYFFNESLSLTSNIRVLYASHSGKYESREIDPNQSQTTVREYKLKEFVTKIGLGLNFYF